MKYYTENSYALLYAYAIGRIIGEFILGYKDSAMRALVCLVLYSLFLLIWLLFLKLIRESNYSLR
jgi:hypothetical protein